jgi:hypothetical protein
VVTTRTVVVNVPKGCAVGGQGFATYNPLGDFEPPMGPAQVPLSTLGAPLPQFDAQAQAVSAIVNLEPNTWEGVADVPPSGDLNVLVLPELQPCALTQNVGMRTGSTLAPIGSQLALLVGGTGSSAIPADYVVRLDTGQVTALPGTHELSTPRTQASVTRFGAGGLVAGGIANPDSNPLPTNDAQIFDPAVGGFTTHIPLVDARAAHAAVVLADGRTLLVGGLGGADGLTPLRTMEIVDPSNNMSNEANLPLLPAMFTAPLAVRLASGEVLVAGIDGSSGTPLVGLQWFSPTVGMPQPPPPTPPPIPAGQGAPALMALQGGGALLVLAPPAQNPPANFQTTWVINADKTVAAAQNVPGNLTQPLLFGGAGGLPLLWTGEVWLQWQPWAVDPAPQFISARVNGTTGTVGTGGGAVASPDPGLAMWLDPTLGQLVALRYDVNGPFAGDPSGGYLGTSMTGVAPDRLPGPTTLSYAVGALTLTSGASAFITDRTFADVSIHVAYAVGQAPFVVLRDATGAESIVNDDEVAGGTNCCSNMFSPKLGPQPTLDIVRMGGAVTCALNGGPASPCASAPSAGTRMSLGVRGALPSVPSLVTNLVVTRLGPP